MREGHTAEAVPLRASAAPWLRTLKGLIFPIFCKECGVRLHTEENGFFCPACWERSPRIERPFCTGCGRPHQQMVGLGARGNFPCAQCRAKPNRHIRRTFAPAIYDGAVAEAIKLLKFGGRERLAGPLSEMLVEFAQAEMEPEAYDLLVPVPLHKVRQRARGFNQSKLLAEQILPIFPTAVIDESLKRIRPTRTQSKLQGTDRHSNVRGAFAVFGDTCKGKTILLVDDVVTTTGTVTECARALRRAGAGAVDVLAVALAAKLPNF
jgi:ComF family protein